MGDGPNEDVPTRKGKAKKGANRVEDSDDDEPAKPAKGAAGKKAKGKKGRGDDESDEDAEDAKPTTKKGKKGKRGDDSDEEEEAAKPAAKAKKGKKKGAEESDDEAEVVKPAAKGKKGRKKGGDESEEDEEPVKPAAKGKKGKKKGGDESDEEEEEAKPAKGKKGKKKGGDESDDEEEEAKPAKGKKGKKKGGDESDDEDEVKPATKGKKGKKAVAEESDDEAEAKQPAKAKKGKKKGGDESDGEEEEEEKQPVSRRKQKKGKVMFEESGEEDDEMLAAPALAKNKKNKKQKDSDDEHVPAAPKKKMGGFALLDDGDDEDDDDGTKDVDSAKEDVEEPEKVNVCLFILIIFSSKEAAVSKKKKKKDKKAAAQDEAPPEGAEEAKDKEETAAPAAAAAAAAETKKAKKLKQEQERKERKKQKEKERRERAKAEGRLLTKAQKTARARMEATLKALKEQGIEVPQIGEKKEKVARMDRRRNQRLNKKPNEEAGEAEKKAETIPQVQLEILGPDGTAPSEQNELQKEMSPTEVPEEEEDDVKDAWDATSSSEEEEEDEEEVSEAKMKADAKPETKTAAPKKPAPAKKAETAKKRQESSSSESEDEDSESDDSSEESSSDSEDDKSHSKEKVMARLQRQRDEAEKKRSVDNLRSPVICVLGHVDTGKTKILDTIRHTHVQDSEAGGITQQIGATMVPLDAIKEQCKMAKEFANKPLKIPGLLIIDTPGHESFSNLRSRGSSLCDMAILVVDLMHGLEPQTIESLNMLRSRKTPFVVALNKVDRLYDWKGNRNKDITDVLKAQSRNTRLEFEERTREVVLQFAEQGLNAALFHENKDQRTFISLVPTSALSGDGMGNLISLIVDLTQNMMAKRIAFSEELQATVLEVGEGHPGAGHDHRRDPGERDAARGDTMVLAGHEGPFTTPIRSLLMPQPMKELRVKNPYQEYKEVRGAQGVKIAAKDLDKAIAGLQVLVAHHPDEVEVLKEEVARALKEVMSGFRLSERGVYVQASTLGSLEALLEFLRVSKISYSGIRIGPVVKKDVMKASIMLEHDAQRVIDVKIERDAQELADSLGVKIFQADIIYHLFDKFTAYREELRQKKREEFKSVAVFPCKLRILPQFVFNSRDPIVVGVSIEAGVVKEGTPLCVPSKEFLDIGIVTTIEVNHKQIESARKGQEVCIKIEPLGGEAPKMYGRHFDHTDFLVSKISRASIDACKEHFRDDLIKTDWQLMVELKKLFQIL
ncbi:hypothetical protein HPB48_018629 [Haemaphysalis longicornis]|uniref:Eukaryotic translation initiation factor 5B n=1 Tax=Haemaphysalis longicornis TaxID=44386 RepID=A0A9J6G5R0_HAELO|nr:hypothetical protein HPB48_018629 [Haemaphysalis longicornis]